MQDYARCGFLYQRLISIQYNTSLISYQHLQHFLTAPDQDLRLVAEATRELTGRILRA